MNMDYLSGGSTALLEKLQRLGHDQDSLLYISNDYFGLCDQLGLNARQTAEIFIRIKKAHSVSKGAAVNDLYLYENNRYNPSRLCVENRATAHVIFLKIIPGQMVTEKRDILYTCESCSSEIPIKRSEAKDHIIQCHV